MKFDVMDFQESSRMNFITNRISVFISAIIIVTIQIIFAQSATTVTTPSITATYLDGDIVLDGRLTEPIWQKSEPATRFIQLKPVEGAPAEEKTKVYVLYDESALYVGAMMYDSEPDRIGDQIVRRDELGESDNFELSLDTNNDRLTGYRFRVNAAGVQSDVYLYNDVQNDVAWDAVWQSQVYRDSTGWSAELRIPFSQLQYEKADSVQSWGINFSRRRIASNEQTYFALESQLQHGKVSVFGRLRGLHITKSAQRFEVLPYVLGNMTKTAVEVNNPFRGDTQFSSRIGFDLRYGLSGSYNLDVTINPDFGQVEVDPAVINLTAFETFFPEKRPFFIKDAQIFDFHLLGRNNQLFYSRRVGRGPQGFAPDEADFESVPMQTTILGAGKLTGRSSSGLSIGVLAALTDAETGKAYLQSRKEFLSFNAEPRAMHAVVRASQDFRNGASQIGGIVTGIFRSLPADGSLDFLNSDAYSYGIDFKHNWGGPTNQDWAIEGHIAGSTIKGSPEALTEVQTASNHYFQRPDAIGYSLDTTATSMSGRTWEVSFVKLSGEHWTGRFWINETTPGFEVNDIGYSTESERVGAGGNVRYQEIKPGPLFRTYQFRLFTDHVARHSLLKDISWKSLENAYSMGVIELSTGAEFLNYWGLNLSFGHSIEHYSAVATRGGPLMTEPGNAYIQIGANTDSRKSLFFAPSFRYQDGLRGGYQWSTQLRTTLRPYSGLEIQIDPGYSRDLDLAQYVDTIDDPGYTPTFGYRYLFGELQRQTFSLETRFNLALNPKLTIQLYSQIFVSSGKYQNYKLLKRPESFDFDFLKEGIPGGGQIDTRDDGYTWVRDGERYIDLDGNGISDYSLTDEDFNIRSLKLNAVLRWEYLPGSTLFVVWQHSRYSDNNIGLFDFGHSLNRLWNTQPDNAIIVKLNYWFGM